MQMGLCGILALKEAPVCSSCCGLLFSFTALIHGYVKSITLKKALEEINESPADIKAQSHYDPFFASKNMQSLWLPKCMSDLQGLH
jgi:hypothetical protein